MTKKSRMTKIKVFVLLLFILCSFWTGMIPLSLATDQDLFNLEAYQYPSSGTRKDCIKAGESVMMSWYVNGDLPGSVVDNRYETKIYKKNIDSSYWIHIATYKGEGSMAHSERLDYVGNWHFYISVRIYEIQGPYRGGVVNIHVGTDESNIVSVNQQDLDLDVSYSKIMLGQNLELSWTAYEWYHPDITYSGYYTKLFQSCDNGNTWDEITNNNILGLGSKTYEFTPLDEGTWRYKVAEYDNQYKISEQISGTVDVLPLNYEYLDSDIPLNGWIGNDPIDSTNDNEDLYGAFISCYEGKENALEIKNSDSSNYRAIYEFEKPKIRGIFTIETYLQTNGVPIGLMLFQNKTEQPIALHYIQNDEWTYVKMEINIDMMMYELWENSNYIGQINFVIPIHQIDSIIILTENECQDENNRQYMAGLQYSYTPVRGTVDLELHSDLDEISDFETAETITLNWQSYQQETSQGVSKYYKYDIYLTNNNGLSRFQIDTLVGWTNNEYIYTIKHWRDDKDTIGFIIEERVYGVTTPAAGGFPCDEFVAFGEINAHLYHSDFDNDGIYDKDEYYLNSNPGNANDPIYTFNQETIDSYPGGWYIPPDSNARVSGTESAKYIKLDGQMLKEFDLDPIERPVYFSFDFCLNFLDCEYTNFFFECALFTYNSQKLTKLLSIKVNGDYQFWIDRNFDTFYTPDSNIDPGKNLASGIINPTSRWYQCEIIIYQLRYLVFLNSELIYQGDLPFFDTPPILNRLSFYETPPCYETDFKLDNIILEMFNFQKISIYENVDNYQDTDGDLMPDIYEFVYNFNPKDPTDANDDDDNDGFKNIDEYIFNTHPRDDLDNLYKRKFELGEDFENLGDEELLHWVTKITIFIIEKFVSVAASKNEDFTKKIVLKLIEKSLLSLLHTWVLYNKGYADEVDLMGAVFSFIGDSYGNAFEVVTSESWPDLAENICLILANLIAEFVLDRFSFGAYLAVEIAITIYELSVMWGEFESDLEDPDDIPFNS